MLHVLSDSLWDQIGKLAALEGRKMAAVAYMSDDSVVKFGKGDTLVVDASDRQIATGQTSARVLWRALKREARLVSVPNLHAKVMVFGSITVIGSSNISKLSRQGLCEAAIETDRVEALSSAIQLIEKLADRGQPIDKKFIARINQIKVVRVGGLPMHKQSKGVHINQPRHWIVVGADNAQYPGNEDTVNKICESVKEKYGNNTTEIDWLWWDGNSRFMRDAQAGDILIYLGTPKTSDTTMRRVTAYKHAIIKRVFQERGQRAKTFHCVWPLSTEYRPLGWGEFKKLAQRAKVQRKIGLYTCREISERESSALSELWSK